jgi:hypothetical protein
MAQVDEFLAEMLPRWQPAYRALCRGDVEPWAAIWSTREPITLFAPPGRQADRKRYDGSRSGWPATSPDWWTRSRS